MIVIDSIACSTFRNNENVDDDKKSMLVLYQNFI